MDEPRDGSTEDRALWRRWSMTQKAGNGAVPGGDAGPNPLTLAEFAENRLSGPDAASVQAFLAANPAVAGDVAAASRAVEIPPRIGDAALAATIARAAALVPARSIAAGAERTGDNILPLRAARPSASAWPAAARWSALAASLALVSWFGFALGGDAYGDLASLDGQAGVALADEIFDPPGGFFGLADTSGT